MPSSSFPFLPTKANLPQRLKPARLLAGYCSAKALLHPKAPSKSSTPKVPPQSSTQKLRPGAPPNRAVQLGLTHITARYVGGVFRCFPPRECNSLCYNHFVHTTENFCFRGRVSVRCSRENSPLLGL